MTLTEFIAKISEVILNPLILLMFSVALLVFLWGVFSYIRNGDNESKRTEGKQHILYGLLGMFIMISVYGIMEILINTFVNIPTS